MNTYRLPPTFILDHIARDLLDVDAIVRETKRYVDVRLTPDQVKELRSDAKHYADPGNGYADDYFGLVTSARATLRRLDDASRPIAYSPLDDSR